MSTTSTTTTTTMNTTTTTTTTTTRNTTTILLLLLLLLQSRPPSGTSPRARVAARAHLPGGPDDTIGATSAVDIDLTPRTTRPTPGGLVSLYRHSGSPTDSHPDPRTHAPGARIVPTRARTGRTVDGRTTGCGMLYYGGGVVVVP